MAVSVIDMAVLTTSTPATRRDFWERKFAENVNRDRKNVEVLTKDGWRVLIVWECAIKGKAQKSLPLLCTEIFEFLKMDGCNATCEHYSSLPHAVRQF
jgi:DNA mismatch endonuclease (patch repair protein)